MTATCACLRREQLSIARNTFKRQRRHLSAAAGPSDTRQSILDAALPHIDEHGFTSAAILAGSTSPSLTLSSLEALFPSPRLPRDSASRPERVGPAQALVQHWLDRGCSTVAEELKSNGLKGREGVSTGLHSRLRYNEPIIHLLPDALSLLVSPDTFVPLPNPLRYGGHAAAVADAICWEAMDKEQGERWYAERARLTAIYAAAELRMLNDDSPDYVATHTLTDNLLSSSDRVSGALADSLQFVGYVARSWQGIFRSRGL